MMVGQDNGSAAGKAQLTGNPGSKRASGSEGSDNLLALISSGLNPGNANAPLQNPKTGGFSAMLNGLLLDAADLKIGQEAGLKTEGANSLEELLLKGGQASQDKGLLAGENPLFGSNGKSQLSSLLSSLATDAKGNLGEAKNLKLERSLSLIKSLNSDPEKDKDKENANALEMMGLLGVPMGAAGQIGKNSEINAQKLELVDILQKNQKAKSGSELEEILGGKSQSFGGLDNSSAGLVSSSLTNANAKGEAAEASYLQQGPELDQAARPSDWNSFGQVLVGETKLQNGLSEVAGGKLKNLSLNPEQFELASSKEELSLAGHGNVLDRLSLLQKSDGDQSSQGEMNGESSSQAHEQGGIYYLNQKNELIGKNGADFKMVAIDQSGKNAGAEKLNKMKSQLTERINDALMTKINMGTNHIKIGMRDNVLGNFTIDIDKQRSNGNDAKGAVNGENLFTLPKNDQNISIKIVASEQAGLDFFNQHKNDLIEHLGKQGIFIKDMGVSSENSSFASKSEGSFSRDHLANQKNGEVVSMPSAWQNSSGRQEQNQREQDSERRKNIWDVYKDKLEV